jgi:hypothetical protein
MFTPIDKERFFHIFNINSTGYIKDTLENEPPSVVEYHLSLLESSNEPIEGYSLHIKDLFSFGIYNVLIDHEDNIYLEVNRDYSVSDTASFW